MTNNMFYPDIKDGMSPSAIAQWLNGRGSFVKTYFMGEKSPETAAMKGGTRIHRLIEAGLIKAKHVFDNAEDEISVTIAEGMVFRGRPDSWGIADGETEFVDYKSGKANEWKDKLPTDIKMRATAFLVWKKAGEPARVKAYIEFIQTTWNPDTKEVVPIEGQETEVVEITYTAEEMETMGKVILREMNEVNDFYVKWQKSSSEFVSKEDVEAYAAIDAEITKLEAERDSLKKSIMSQMQFGGAESIKTDFGTFFLTEKETYEYPAGLRINYLDYGLTVEDAEEISAAAKAAKKNFELANEPVSTKTSISFRAKKEE